MARASAGPFVGPARVVAVALALQRDERAEVAHSPTALSPAAAAAGRHVTHTCDDFSPRR